MTKFNIINKINSKAIKILLAIMLFSNINYSNLFGLTPEEEAQEFVSVILSDIYAFLPNHQDNKQIYSYFETLTNDKFDADYVAMWSIGQYGKKMDDAVKSQYLAVARRYMVLVYGSVFQKYYAEYKYKITGSELLDDNSYAVKFFIEPKKSSKRQDNTIFAYWKIVNNNGLKVADIVVNGISLSNAQRFEFERDMKAQNGDLEMFIKKLDSEVLANEKTLGLK